ncbi:hypothetical protein SDC9_133386 [bioreactor metagenome]|uniref:Uncharacterized protein n=1 Tax=bioreactor metagenome TaxID=1076179 RepID=A0A645DAS7_9ZZZZ
MIDQSGSNLSVLHHNLQDQRRQRAARQRNDVQPVGSYGIKQEANKGVKDHIGHPRHGDGVKGQQSSTLLSGGAFHNEYREGDDHKAVSDTAHQTKEEEADQGGRYDHKDKAQSR